MSSSRRRDSSGLRIKAFPTAIGGEYVNNIWEQLRSAIKEIQNKNNSGLSFEELYRNAYTLVLQKHGEMLYANTRSVVQDHVSEVRNELLNHLNDDFLNVLQVTWKDHQNAMIMIRDILMYMDRVFVEQQKYPRVYNMGMDIFCKVILECPQIHKALLSTLLDMVRRERMGEFINRSQIRDACQMLVHLGDTSLHVYRDYFQRPLLDQTREFYAAEVQNMLAENISTPEFIDRVNMRIEEEKKRVDNYLDPSTKPEIVSLLETELITKNLQAVVDMPQSGLTFMLKNDRFDEITSMYRLIKSVHMGPSVMNDVMCNYFAAEGAQIVAESGSSNAQQYVQDLINLRDKAERIIEKCVQNSNVFRNKLNSAFESFVNKSPRSPEFLSLFIDDKLRRGIKGVTDQDIDRLFDKCIAIFRFLHEKDMFERYYKQHLARRLLLGKSQSDDQERSMISKLMVECGSMFTSKFESMIKDVTVSKSLDNEFSRQHPRSTLPIDITVRVLTAGLWPTEKENQGVQLPEEALQAFEVYQNFYLGKHSGRKITVQSNLGSGELTAVFYGKAAAAAAKKEAGGEGSSAPGGPTESSSAASGSGSAAAASKQKKGRSHILVVSTYQMIVLMKFNRRPSYTFSELAEETGIPERDLNRSLTSMALCKSSQRILAKEPKSKSIEPTDVFSVNEAFTSEHFRVRVQHITTKETEPERQETQTAVEENRRYVIEATIVRIMKTRKTLEHNLLVAEVIEQLKSRFNPSLHSIKVHIELLIERSFLSRSENDWKVIKYEA